MYMMLRAACPLALPKASFLPHDHIPSVALGKRPPICWAGMVGGMLAVQIPALGVGDASALKPGEGAIHLPEERRKGKVRVSAAAGWPWDAAGCCWVLAGCVNASTCQRLPCHDLFCFYFLCKISSDS